MKKSILIISLLIFIFSIKPSNALAFSDTFYRAVAGFVYNFPKMVKDDQGNLCVYGYDQVAVSIEEKYKGVTFFKNDAELSSDFAGSHCKVLYISKNKDAGSLAIKFANQAKIVSIGIDEDFVEKGGMVFVRMGRRSFELTIHHKNIKEFKIKFDPVVEGLVVN